MERTRDRALGLLALVSTGALLVLGWWTFWFLCDDAYIAFRYVSNRQFGYGYTWNPPPFRPVEGYTSWWWVVLLDLVWTAFGVEPPDSANVLSLGFSLASWAVIGALAWRMPLSERLRPYRLALFVYVLVSTVTNRTFLAWTSSGLETAMNTFLVLLWLTIGLLGTPSRGWLLAWVATASMMPLCRPDGLLYLGVTGLVGLWWLRRAWSDGTLSFRDLLPAAPVVVPIAHEVWRIVTYHQVVPNTYYAKHVGVWPLAGLLYVASFLLEYAYWVLLFVAIDAARRTWRRSGWARGLVVGDRAPATLAIGAVLFHFAYYTFSVGGDHFEYRMYQHLVPLVPVALVAILDQVHQARPRRIAMALVVMFLVGLPIPWVHWYGTHELSRREQTFKLRYQVAPEFPVVIRFYPLAWDLLQHWLIDHFVGVRHQGHKVFLFNQQQTYPTRAEGSLIDDSEHPVRHDVSVGVAGWVLPHVAFLDRQGLNDFVVAHSRPANVGQVQRMMAHDRTPPPGYVECFQPNVGVSGGHARVKARAEPLTAEDIVRCEQEWWDAVTE